MNIINLVKSICSSVNVLIREDIKQVRLLVF